MKNIKLKNIKTNKVVEFKPYLIGDIPPSFNKHTDIYVNKAGITYIEQKESIWDML